MYSNHKHISENKKAFLFYSIFIKLISISIIVGFILRVILLYNDQTIASFYISDFIKIFSFGFINDVLIAIIASFFMWFNLIFLSDNKYKYPWGYIIFSLILISFIYMISFNTIFHDYGSIVPKIVTYVLLFKLISFGLRLFIPKIRKNWSYFIFITIFFLYIICIIFNAVSEYFFWNEFGVRYNFIAVDYLIYTNEVIGNIIESYPVIPLFSLIVITTIVITYILTRKTKVYFNNYIAFKQKLILSVTYFILFGISCFMLNLSANSQKTDNVYINELQANGFYKFYNAFINSKLEYMGFYPTLANKKAVDILNAENNSNGINNFHRVNSSLPEIHKNIVLITVKSLSAYFIERFGDKNNTTPYLNKLIDESLSFNNLFANGNRTVRGLEAVTLSKPPSAGESIVKQKNNSDLFSIANVLKEKGYIIQYLYAGDGYFDNMKTFFSGNGYDVIDKKKFNKNEITFSNIWGVCDENMFNKAINVFRNNAKSGKPFFGHLMTVSNHRPFTYPENK